MIQKNDFIEIEYTGKTKEEGIVFDTTIEQVAKDNDITDENASYGPTVICVGHSQIIAGLDNNLAGKEIGKDYTITLQPEEAFGKKSAKLVQLIPFRKFTQQQIMPQIGLQVNIDGNNGIIKTVSGGRVLVDFNHPLSGKVIEYDVKILRKVEDDNEKLKSYIKVFLGNDVSAEIKEGRAIVELPMEMEQPIALEFSKAIQEAIPAIKEVEFRKIEKKEKTEKKEEKSKEENSESKKEPTVK